MQPIDARARLLFALGGGALGVLALAWSFHYSSIGPTDFRLFWYIGGHPQAAYHVDLVQKSAFQAFGTPGPAEDIPFLYPPTFVLLLTLAPTHFLPLIAANLLWSGAWCAAFVWVASREARWATPLLVLSVPMLWSAANGQTGVPVAALIIAGMQRLDRAPRLAGVLLALAACIKPQALIVAPIILWGRWETVRWAIACGVVVALASMLLGWRIWLDWWEALPRFSHVIEPSFPKVAPRYLFPGPVWRLATILAGVAFAWRERNVTGLLVGSLLCTPYVQYYDLAGFSYLGVRMIAEARDEKVWRVPFGLLLTVCPAWPVLTTIYCAALAGLSTARSWKPPAYQT